MLDKIYKETDHKMVQAREHTQQELGHLRTGRAHTGLVEGLKVEAYGTTQELRHMANISTPDATTILITPWDRSQIPAVEKAVQTADLGMNPSSDGTNVRLTVPALTQERRKEIVREAHKLAEQGRVAVRNVRHHANDEIKKLEKDKEISEDESRKAQKKIQELTDRHVKEIDDSLAHKEEEIMTV